MIGVETLRGCPHAACASVPDRGLACDCLARSRNAIVSLLPVWRHRGGFSYLPPYEGPPRV
jgi:hypothetical protein